MNRWSNVLLRCNKFGFTSLYFINTATADYIELLYVRNFSNAFIELYYFKLILEGIVCLTIGIDLSTGTIVFTSYNAIGTALVLIGFMILVIPNNVVSLELRTFKVRLRPTTKFVLKHIGEDNMAMTEDTVKSIVYERANGLI